MSKHKLLCFSNSSPKVVNRWLSVRLELMGAAIVFSAAFFVTVVFQRSPGMVCEGVQWEQCAMGAGMACEGVQCEQCGMGAGMAL